MNKLLTVLSLLFLGLFHDQFSLSYAQADKKKLSDQKQEVLSQIKTLPYLSGYEPAPKKVGVMRYDKKAAYPGLNLFISAHAPRSFLMDMNGEVLHEWSVECENVWPGIPESEVHWRRVHLFDNGELLAIFPYCGLVKLDKNSKVLWSYRTKCHHDLSVAEGGNIYLSTTRKLIKHEKLTLSRPIDEDCITILDPQGKVLKTLSILECFLNSDYASVLNNVEWTEEVGDVFHTNTIELFDGRLAKKLPMFRKGNLLISIRNISTIAIIDPIEEKVV